MVTLDIGKGIDESAAEGQDDGKEPGFGQVTLIKDVMHNESSLK